MILRSRSVLGSALLLLAACGEAVERPAPAAAEAVWRAPPRVDRVAVEAGRLQLTGSAQPGARVVMRDGAGQAHAATAGPDGAFVLGLPASPQPVLLRPEDQDGERSAPGPDVILVLPDGAAVALSPGVPSRRLDPGEGLSAVDSDGRMAIVSGRTGRAQPRVRVQLGTAAEMEIPVDAEGVWTVRTDVAGLGQSVVVDGAEHRPVLSATVPGSISTDAEGARIGWAAPDGAALVTWIPAR
ncbi:MAG: hypothetical protein KJ676_11060 [Alphaproteobacteria bacterium]|nr:hypothetical protein [Alphaproteobacteria bacterium]MBU1526930.1 hypothetical protein [Alphaproteobacteria bacterium]MBU2352520.1 hypothetical protein [Alphaproteobacteria bacterium]MBU2383001.1 hypothetical protein [Alphaproteobacteria bacterium]